MTHQLFDNRYHFLKLLGEGGFGKVFLAKEDHSDLVVAIKQLNNKDKERTIPGFTTSAAPAHTLTMNQLPVKSR